MTARLLCGFLLVAASACLHAQPYPAWPVRMVVPLGITSLKPSPMLPDVKPIAEQGLPGFEVENLYALLAAAGTPPDIVRRVNDELRTAMQSPDVKDRLQADGSRIITGTPDELEKTIVAEIAKWSKVIKTAGVQAPY